MHEANTVKHAKLLSLLPKKSNKSVVLENLYFSDLSETVCLLSSPGVG